MNILPPLAVAALLAAPALADSHVTGDAEAGEESFARMCASCHVVVNEAGETLAGKRAKTGPNLYGVAGGAVGAQDDFRYSSSMEAAGEAGHVWTEEAFVAYVQDPTGWLREVLDDSRARGKMSFKVRDEADALNLYAFLAKIGPEPEEDSGDAAATN